MKKNIYSMFNEVDSKIENYDCLPMSNEEVNEIMKQINNKNTCKKSHMINKKSVIIGFATAAACFVGVLGVSVNMPTNKNNTSIISTNQAEEKKENSFFLVASADEANDMVNNNYLTFESTSGMIPFSGRVFFIEGNNIKNVHISIDKGSLYKADFNKIRTIKDGEIVESSDSCEYIGNNYTEKYNSDRCFGFYFPEDAWENHAKDLGEENLKKICHACYDDFDNSLITVTVTYNDNSIETSKYRLNSGKLEINPETMKPNGNFTNGDKPYIYGLMMKKEN